jgi:hypothetical protein
MHDSKRSIEEGIDLDRASTSDDPWFGWSEPDQRRVKEYWTMRRIDPESIEQMPFVPLPFLDKLYDRVCNTEKNDLWAAELLSRCRNRAAVDIVARAWRMRVAARSEALRDRTWLKGEEDRSAAADEYDRVTNMLRETLVNWDCCAADTVRCLLADESAQVRAAAAQLLAEIGDLRDIGIFDDLLRMSPTPDEEAGESAVIAEAMERLARRLNPESPAAG